MPDYVVWLATQPWTDTWKSCRVKAAKNKSQFYLICYVSIVGWGGCRVVVDYFD